jgi:hypothetical protein
MQSTLRRDEGKVCKKGCKKGLKGLHEFICIEGMKEGVVRKNERRVEGVARRAARTFAVGQKRAA